MEKSQVSAAENAAGVRNVGRNLNVSHNTISNRIVRMGRNAIIVVGAKSQFVYRVNYSPLRRKGQDAGPSSTAIAVRPGRMTTVQKRERALIERIWKPSPKAGYVFPLGSV